MTEQEVIEKIDSSLAEEFELDRTDMTPEANIYDDLGLDSLDTVDMVIVLEGAFDFKIRYFTDGRRISIHCSCCYG